MAKINYSKYIKYISIIIIALILIVVLFSIFTTDKQNTNNTEIKSFLISDNGPIPKDICINNNLSNKIIVIESKYCSHCKNMIKETINPIEKETDYKFNLYDVSEPDKAQEIKNMGLSILGTPTTIVNCNAFIGEINKEDMLQILAENIELE